MMYMPFKLALYLSYSEIKFSDNANNEPHNKYFWLIIGCSDSWCFFKYKYPSRPLTKMHPRTSNLFKK